MSQHTGKALWCAICRTRRTEQELDSETWAEIHSLPAAYVIYSSAAHTWQGDKDGDSGKTVLDEAADPSDISLAVSEDGHVMFGGTLNPEVIRPDDIPIDIVERVETYQDQAEQHAGSWDDTVYGQYAPNDGE